MDYTANYIRDIRALVGSRPLILAAAAVLILGDGKLLFQQRADNGLWGLPGGFMEPGEAPEETARREVFEETGLEAGPLELLGVVAGHESFYEYLNGDQVFIVSITYLAQQAQGEPRVGDSEGLDLRYFALDALPEALMPPAKPILARFAQRLREV